MNEHTFYKKNLLFQLWQQIFKETFQQYRRLSCSLLENENNSAVFELWHDYLMYVQEFLKSPVPGDYHSLTSHERLCQIHQEVLVSQMDTIPNCMNKPDIISEPATMERFTSLMDLHNETMTELGKTHQEVWTKLGHWKDYRTNVKKVYEWLWKVEKVHSNLNLKFINTRRLPQLKSQITVSKSSVINLRTTFKIKIKICLLMYNHLKIQFLIEYIYNYFPEFIK